MSKYQFGSIVDRNFRRTLQRLADDAAAQGKAIQDLVADGQLTPQQYADLVTIVNGNLKSGDVTKYDLQEKLRNEIEDKRNKSVPIGLNDFNKNVLAAIEGGEGSSFDLLSIPRPHSVKPSSTTFVRRGKNLFEGEYTNAVLNGATTYYYNPDEVSKVAIVEVEPNTSYAISKSTDTDRFRVAAFSGYPEHGDTTDNGTQLDGSSVRYITTDETQDHLVIYVSTDGSEPSQLQVEEGTTVTEYEEPGSKVRINLHEDSFPDVNEDMVTFMTQSEKNLFDGIYYDGYMAGISPYTLMQGGAKYAVIQVKQNTVYTISRAKNTSLLRIGQFTSFPNVGDAPSSYAQPDTDQHTLQTNEGVNYLVIVPTSTSENKEPEWMQVEEGSKATELEHYRVMDKKFLPNLSTSQSAQKEELNFMIKGDLNQRYSVQTPAPTMNTSLDLQTVYDTYDNLVTNYPDYVSRELLIEESSGLPIYLYDFKPPSTGRYNESLPKILHVNGIHGDEKQSLASGMRFYTDLCNSWQDDELLKILRWNIHFVVIPAFNAYGVDNSQRRNYNDVDLNRNFPPDWEQSTYSGSGPLSEVESQALANFLDQNDGFIFAIDHHRYNPFANDGYTIWTGTANDDINKFLAAWSRDETGEFIKAHPSEAAGNASFVYVQESYAKNMKGWLGHYFVYKSIPGTILEVSADSAFNDYHTEAMASLFAYASKTFHNDTSGFIN